MATIKDVARLSHAGVATVSRVLNHKGYVKSETRKNIEAAIKELSYVPNEVARSLYRKKSQSIGIIVPRVSSIYISGLLEFIEDETIQRDYHLLICNSKNNKERESKYLKMFKQNNVAGVILISNTTQIHNYRKLGIPIITIDHKPYPDIPSVSSNNAMGGRLAAEKLISCGCKNILHFGGPSTLFTVQNRHAGFLSVIEKHSLPVHYDTFDFGNPSLIDLEAALRANPTCDGIFCDSDLIAMNTIKILQNLHRRVPEDVKVVGFDNIFFSNLMSPRLTTISQPSKNIGRYAVVTLLDLIDGKPIAEQHHQFDVELVERETTI